MPWPINGEEAEVEWFYEDLQDLLQLTPKTGVHFIIGDRNAKLLLFSIIGPLKKKKILSWQYKDF